MDDLIAEFLTETNESIADLDNDLVKLEQNPNDTDLLSGIFRLMHTIKGTCGFLGLERLEKVAHKAEDVLGRFRDKELEVTAEYMTLIFESLDRIKYIISEIEQNGAEPEGNDDELRAKLEAAYEGKSLDEAADAPSDSPSSESENDQNIFDERSGESEGLMQEEEDQVPEDVSENAEEAQKKTPPAGSQDKEATAPQEMKAKESALSAQTLRVSVDVLEDLMTMVSELVLTRNQIMQIMRTHKENDLSGPLQNLNQVVSELQDGVMKTRMQPIGNAWSKLPRIIRDISTELGKKIDLQMKGQDTELDRQVLEMIKDPLTHMVRNSADHGVEDPEDRVAAGKPETGKITLNAYHEGGHIIIEIKDDGKGLPIDKIKKKVLDKGLASEDELEKMSGHQIQQFIFKAGFSTADQVTAVSGRGVGMDVVRSNIENIGGSVELNSIEGKGTTFYIKIPLTLAIVSALIVESSKEKFAIPQLAVRELVMATENGKSRIEMIKGTPVFRLRDHLLPLVSLRELLHLKEVMPEIEEFKKVDKNDSKYVSENSTDHSGKNEVAEFPQQEPASRKGEGEAAASKENHDQHGATENVVDLKEKRYQSNQQSDSQYIIVTQVGSYQFGLIVDQVYDTEEIVVKPVSKILRDIDLFSGNTIMGDGSVIMILDPAGIAKTTGEIENSEISDSQTDIRKSDSYNDKMTSLLLFTAGDKSPKAVPLALVARLENIKIEDIEYAGDQMLVQYRGKLMPLTKMSSNVNMEDVSEKSVLVFSAQDKAMGLIVDDILDILEDKIDVQYNSGKQGVLGSAIINEQATDVIDVSYYVQSTDKEWFGATKSYSDHTEQTSKRRILLVDDSPFFRNMMAPLLSTAGYEVTVEESAIDAIRLLEKGEIFDVIVSDIEMPDMSGFEFAEKVRGNKELKQTPLVALSSHATSEDISRGEKAGFQKYVAKFDKDTLLSAINETVADDREGAGNNAAGL